MKKILLILSLFLSICSFGQVANKITDKEVKEYTKRITGVFSTLEQHKSDSTFDDVVVYTKLIRRDFNNVYWIYTEQGEAKNYKPYRQRVYQIAEVWGRILQRIYYINDASKYSYFKSETIESITIDDLQLKPGCDLIVQLNDNVYSSQTEDKFCVATFRGSTYTTTDFKVYKDAVLSWERGWNKQDEQVWGSRKGHYIYKKISKK